jgi:hypothetical protein
MRVREERMRWGVEGVRVCSIIESGSAASFHPMVAVSRDDGSGRRTRRTTHPTFATSNAARLTLFSTIDPIITITSKCPLLARSFYDLGVRVYLYRWSSREDGVFVWLMRW